MRTAEVITIGTEIMAGQIVDSNAQHISKMLTENGIHVLFQTSIGDDENLLKSALRIARDRVKLIIITGGLGPTANDITREAVSDFFSIPLIPDKESQLRLQRYLVNRHTTRKNEYRRQRLIPEGSVVLYNDNGTATGFAVRHEKKEIVCLPG
ncbi:MAG: competence/damage-inducible protein A, partial [Candidatus Brocadia sp.]